MYETYFNLTERPFASVPRADHYYPASVIDAARNTLTRCIDRGEGAALIVGPSGTGKSLLCQVLAEHFQKSFQVALLASTHLDTRRSLLQAILYELNRPWRGMDEGELRLSLVDYITLNDDCGGGILLLVDEAHRLSLRLLDEIRTLTNLTRAMQPAVRLVLAGNHVLEERFASPKLESFGQRISARCYLEAFQRDETQAYIWARIMVSGGRGNEIFPAEACRMVHKATGGVPRLINQVCDHVLLLAYGAGPGNTGCPRRIEPAHVEAAWADLQQLPTPWNAPATAPSGESVIEFGGLDDDPSEMPSIAGKISAAEQDDGSADAAEKTVPPIVPAEPPLDPETSRRLRHVHRLLGDVRTEFQLAAAGPETEPVVETPHPFEEPFDEEEVIAERYSANAPARTIAASSPAPLDPALAATVTPEPGPQTCVAMDDVPSSEPSEKPLSESIRLRLDRAHGTSEPPAQAAGIDAESLLADPPRSVVPPPRIEFGRLFAKLRQKL